MKKYCPACGSEIPANYKPSMKCVACVVLGEDRNDIRRDLKAEIIRRTRGRELARAA